MSIEMEIPKDIRKYKKKLVGPLTARQTLFSIPAIGLGGLVFFAFKDVFRGDVHILLTILTALPFLMLGWIEVYGMPLEKFIKAAFVSTILSPANRKYVTKNTITQTEDKPTKSEKKSGSKRAPKTAYK